MPLYIDCRPKTWAELVGQDKIARRVETMRERGLGSNAFWVSGNSGQGKSTVAYLIAHEVADPFNIQELDASRLTPRRLAELETEQHSYGLSVSRPGRAYIVNEAHGLRQDTVRQLLVTLERLPDHVVWIFTTTHTEAREKQVKLFGNRPDGSALLSRCVRFRLSQRDLAENFAQLVHDIAEREGLNGRPLSAYIRLAKDCRNNCRAMIEAVASGVMLA